MNFTGGNFALAWLFIAVVFGSIEVLVTSLVFLLMGLSAIGPSILAFFGFSIEVQIVVYALVMILSLGLLRPRLLKKMRGTATHIPGRAEALVGKTGETTMDFDHGQGRVTVIGEDWAARSQNNSKGNLRSGTPIRVVGHDGITLIIEQIS